MIDHVTLNVKDLKKSQGFYVKALAPIGYTVIMEYPGGAGLGANKKADFWIRQEGPPGTPVHIAFGVAKRKLVDAFHAAALKAGGRDNGAPGIRADYGPNYYGAFVRDPDGNNIEAVCLDPKG